MKNIKTLFITLALCVVTTSHAQDITGQWNGYLEAFKLRIVVHIDKTDSLYSATLDSPDQGAKGIPVNQTSFKNSTLNLKMDRLNAAYSGTYSNEMFSGTFTQNGFEIPLTLQRNVLEKEAPKRPQEPKAPYPYKVEEVNFKNDSAKITLAGTLTKPDAKGTFPTVILISGSGPQDRNETLAGHKPFLVLADHLTKNGIAVLRFDDRGVGASTGDFNQATSTDFATDVLSAVQYLKTRKDIDASNIGLIGHSEGGMIAPLVAQNSNEVAFIVLLAGTGVRGDKLLLSQQQLIGRASGLSENDLQKAAETNTKAFDMIRASTDSQTLKTDLENYLTKIAEGAPDIKEQLTAQLQQLTSPWMVNFIKHDPALVLEHVNCPVLALNGAKDLQVSAKENLSAIKTALHKGGNTAVTTLALPNLNHLFQECETGLPTEYGLIEQTFAPIALAAISDWILTQTK